MGNLIKGKKPLEPQHSFPAWFYGEVRCDRCKRTLTDIDARCLPCVTDEQLDKAKVASKVFYALRKQR